MKSILIDNQTWYYKTVFSRNHTSHTVFYKTKTLKKKKYIFFGEDIDIENTIPNFSVDFNIEDVNYRNQVNDLLLSALNSYKEKASLILS